MSGTRSSSHPRSVVTQLAVLLLPLVVGVGGHASAIEPARQLLHRTVDLDRGESVRVEFPDVSKATVKLPDVEETRDPPRSAIREARAMPDVNGQLVTLPSPSRARSNCPSRE